MSVDDHEAPPDPASLPSVADGKERRLAPASVTVSRWSGAIPTAIISGALLLFVTLFSIFGPVAFAGALLMYAGWMLTTAGLTALILWWPAVRYRHTAYEVSERGIRIRRGVVWRSVSSVPRSRVQHTDVAQGPIERAYKLATLIVYTAGTHHASVSLDGLPHETALQIRDYLIAGGEDDAV